MGTALETEERREAQAEAEVPPLRPERPRRSREQTERMATEAVRRVQRERGAWRWRLRNWWRGLLSLFGR